jgi:hypothetical protein
MRTRIMNQLQALAINEDKRWKKKLGAKGASRVGETLVGSWTSRRPKELL